MGLRDGSVSTRSQDGNKPRRNRSARSRASGCDLVREEVRQSQVLEVAGEKESFWALMEYTQPALHKADRGKDPCSADCPLSKARTPKESFPQSGPGCRGSRECAAEIHNLKPFVRLNLILCNSSSAHSKQPKPPYRSLFTVPSVEYSQKVENGLFK